jgi:hypothetical protein
MHNQLLPGNLIFLSNQGFQYSDLIDKKNVAFESYEVIHSAAALIHVNMLKNTMNERWDIKNNWHIHIHMRKSQQNGLKKDI